MNIMYLNHSPTPWHYTTTTDISTAVQECIDLGIYDPKVTIPQYISIYSQDDTLLARDTAYVHDPEKLLWKKVFYYIFIANMQNIMEWHVQKIQSTDKIYSSMCIHVYYRGQLDAKNIMDVNNYCLYHRQVDSITDRELVRQDTHGYIRQEYTPSNFHYLCTIPNYTCIENADTRDMIINHITRHHT